MKKIVFVAVLLVVAGGVVWGLHSLGQSSFRAGAPFATLITTRGNSDSLGFTKTSSNAPEALSANLTAQVVEGYRKEFLAMNAAAFSAGDTSRLSAPDSAALDALVTSYAKTGLPIKPLVLQDLTVLSNDSDEALAQYSEKLEQIGGRYKTLTETPFILIVNNFISTKNDVNLRRYADALSRAIPELLALAVPKRFAAMQLTLLNLLQERHSASTMLLTRRDDPVLQLAVAERLPEDMSAEEQIVQEFTKALFQNQ